MNDSSTKVVSRCGLLFLVLVHFSQQVLGSSIVVPEMALSKLVMPDFLVIGQQKTGTSSLALILGKHPQILSSRQKELFYFAGNDGREHCSGLIPYLSRFQTVLSTKKPLRNAKSYKGEYTATYFSCSCCPRLFKLLNPSMKIIVILREPVERAMSRFEEQQNRTRAPFKMQIDQYNNSFSKFADSDATKLQTCINHVRYAQDRQLKDALELDCMKSSNIIGWSAYSVYLKNWLDFFPPNQILVIYTHEMEEDMQKSMQVVEDFLQIKHLKWSQDVLSRRYNTKKNYGWTAFVKTQEDVEEKKEELTEELPKNHSLIQFYKPYMAELLKLLRTHGLRLPFSETATSKFFKYTPELISDVKKQNLLRDE